MKMIKLHNGENGLGKNGFTMEMNEFGDMVSVACIASQCIFLFKFLMSLFFNDLCIFP